MNGFIKACEVWTPSEDRSLLEFSNGLFGDATAFAALSRSMCFGRGEGLPGRAWDEGRPIVLAELGDSYFQRAAAAAAAGIHSAVAMPIFLHKQLSAMLVFFCGDANDGAGAIELWHNDPRVSTDMKLDDGHFGAGGEALEALSRDAYLPRGTGLAGLAWQRGAAVLINDLEHSKRFLRSESAGAIGINRGLALPCSSRGNHNYTLNFLSATKAPLAQRIESWALNDDESALHRLFVSSESDGSLPSGSDGPTLPLREGSIAMAFETGIPQVAAKASSGASADLLAIPIVADGKIGEVVALYF